MNNNNDNNISILRILITILIVSAAVASIIALKNATARYLDNNGNLRNVADTTTVHPDISNDQGIEPSAPILLTDTIVGTDERDSADAGYEDGYWAGYDDAHLCAENASYDESSNFPTEQERRKYALNYKEGYQEGWEVGCRDREAKAPTTEED